MHSYIYLKTITEVEIACYKFTVFVLLIFLKIYTEYKLVSRLFKRSEKSIDRAAT